MTNNQPLIKQCDAMELLRSLDDASVDCLLTDPPYGSNEFILNLSE